MTSVGAWSVGMALYIEKKADYFKSYESMLWFSQSLIPGLPLYCPFLIQMVYDFEHLVIVHLTRCCTKLSKGPVIIDFRADDRPIFLRIAIG